jgi:Ras-related protein Rab-1A
LALCISTFSLLLGLLNLPPC